MTKATDADAINIIAQKLNGSPRRKVFYVDVGNMTPERARAQIDVIKAEMKK